MRPHIERLFLRLRPAIYLPVLSQGCFGKGFVICCARFGTWANQFLLGIFYAGVHVLLFILLFFLVSPEQRRQKSFSSWSRRRIDSRANGFDQVSRNLPYSRFLLLCTACLDHE